MFMTNSRWGWDVSHFQFRVNWFENARWTYVREHGLSWFLLGPLELSWHTLYFSGIAL